MQNRENTHTLLLAQDFLTTFDDRERPALDTFRRRESRRRPVPHDFLVPNLRPDLTPEALGAPAPQAAQSWDRNIPQK